RETTTADAVKISSQRLCSFNLDSVSSSPKIGRHLPVDLKPILSFAPLFLQSPISSFGCEELQIPSNDLVPTIAKTFAGSKL
ncbi:unnamed protein product, partial [Brassica napus]